MSKKILFAIAFALVTTAVAQPPPPPSSGANKSFSGETKQFGIGTLVGEGPYLYGNGGVPIQIHINVAPTLRVAALFDYHSESVEDADSRSDLAIGAQPMFVMRERDMEMLIGGRLLLNFWGVEDAAGNENDGTTTLIGGVFGGNYYLSPYFSMGVQTALDFTMPEDTFIMDFKSALTANVWFF